MSNRTRLFRWAPTWAVMLAVAMLAGLAGLAARQVTTSLRSDPPVQPAAAAVTPDASGALPLPSITAPEPGELAPGTLSDPIIGPPTIQPVDRDPVPDRVTLQAGRLPDFFGPPLAATPPASSGGPGPGSSVERPDDVTTGEAAPPPQPFGVGIRVTTGGHFATVIVGVSGGPDGLAALRVDFGDGGEYRLPAERVAELRDGGTLRVVHRYEPTLTPQPQRATVDATDGAGQSKQAADEFETQAEFLVRFSPLTVTALGDCDLIGKGDFVLKWRFGDSEQESRFDLGKGGSYVVQRFARRFYGVHYPDTHEYSLRIREDDGIPLNFLPVSTHLFDVDTLYAEVIELGTHSYPVTLFLETQCPVRLDHTFTVVLFD